MRASLLGITLGVLLVCLVGWLLVIGRALLLPFVIALIIWYLINALAHAFCLVSLGGLRVPRWLAVVLSLVCIFIGTALVINLVTANLTQLAADAPVYQARLETLLRDLVARLTPEGASDFTLNIRDFLPADLLPRMVTAGASVITTLAGSGALVAIYVIFLLLEQSTFDGKLRRLFRDPERTASALAIRDEISRSILHYVGIKTLVSAGTGALTGLILVAAGLPYAPLFGFIAFVLNYIPTIGSLVAVILPALLALVSYDSLGPFLAITFGLGAIQFTLGNLVEPRLMGSNLNLSPLVILLSLTFWGALWGTVGMIVCVPLTIVALIVCSRFEATRPLAVLLSARGNVAD